MLAHLSCPNCFRDTHKVSGTILNSKVALTACWTSLTGARRRPREGRLANNVIVMAFVISISRRVLKHRALNGGISVNLGHNTLPINPQHLCLLLTMLFVSHYLPAAKRGPEVRLMTLSFTKLLQLLLLLNGSMK